MADKVTPTGFDATARLGSIVKEALGPVPQVCQETVLLDLERARMTAEDALSRLREGMSSDEESDEEMSDEEEGVFCEACNAYYRQGVVAWFTEPFTHNGRSLYSACIVCQERLNLQDRTVAHW